MIRKLRRSNHPRAVSEVVKLFLNFGVVLIHDERAALPTFGLEEFVEEEPLTHVGELAYPVSIDRYHDTNSFSVQSMCLYRMFVAGFFWKRVPRESVGALLLLPWVLLAG